MYNGVHSSQNCGHRPRKLGSGDKRCPRPIGGRGSERQCWSRGLSPVTDRRRWPSQRPEGGVASGPRASLLRHHFLSEHPGGEVVPTARVGAEARESVEGAGHACDARKQGCLAGVPLEDLRPQSGMKDPSENRTGQSGCSSWTGIPRPGCCQPRLLTTRWQADPPKRTLLKSGGAHSPAHEQQLWLFWKPW